MNDQQRDRAARRVVTRLGLAKPSPRAAAELIESADYEEMGATDCPNGCYVEPDGHCPHNYESAGLTARLI